MPHLSQPVAFVGWVVVEDVPEEPDPAKQNAVALETLLTGSYTFQQLEPGVPCDIESDFKYAFEILSEEAGETTAVRRTMKEMLAMIIGLTDREESDLLQQYVLRSQALQGEDGVKNSVMSIWARVRTDRNVIPWRDLWTREFPDSPLP